MASPPPADAGLAPRDQEALLSFLLSPAASTEARGAKERDPAKEGRLSEAQVYELLEAHVPGVADMLDRTEETPVSEYIWLTYENGLPIYRGDCVVQQHTISALRYIFNAAATGTPKGGSDALKRLAEAYQSCQAEQGRTIDALYGKLSGRDASIQDQVLALVDSFKALTLESVVHELNPTAAGMGDESPSEQVPHITSAYLVAVGTDLGLRGVAAAQRDGNRPGGVRPEQVAAAFHRQFNLVELAGALAADVNQQAPDAERVIDRDLLAKWAAAAEESGAFLAHSIYFDEDRAEHYDGRPEPGGEYQPFLSRSVALQVLARMFLAGATKGKQEPAAVQGEEALLAFLLSPAASTERREAARRESEGNAAPIAALDERQVRELLEQHVPNVSFMLDRTGCTPVADYIWMTYNRGLPIYSGNRQVQQHTVQALRYLFRAAASGTPPGGVMALRRLAEAYQSCQAEQGRTIDALYGKLSGRDASLEDQVLALVDSFKALTLEGVVHELNPRAAGMHDGCPSMQAPHITSAYLEAIGQELGMRGVAAAANDQNKPPVRDRSKVMNAFREKFSVKELASAFAADVNQQAADAERVIDRDLLAKWASTVAAASGFDAHSIYFDEERASEFQARPEGQGSFQPFLSNRVAMEVMSRLFLPPSSTANSDSVREELPLRPERTGHRGGRGQPNMRDARKDATGASSQDPDAGASGRRGKGGRGGARSGGKGQGRVGDYSMRGRLVKTKHWVKKGETPEPS